MWLDPMMPSVGCSFRRFGFLGGLILVIVIFTVTAAAESIWVRVKWVADGDTIILRDGRHVRYIGVDTPEMDHEDQPAEPMAKWARSINRRLVQGWRLRLVVDRQDTDRYGRTLAHVYRSDGLWVNAELVRRGCAHVLYQWPNISRSQRLLTDQRDAMINGVGIWQHLKKDERPPQPYLGNRGSRRFHRYDCPMGKRMAKKNRVWLENQWEAFWEGYAPARECITFP